ncbi:hypothetical protein MCEMIEM12_01741 [Burkholderiaceae bacterium]
MKYPQGYIFLKDKTKLPPMEVLEKRFPAGADIYVRGVSKASKVLDDRIVLLEELHRYAMKKSDYQMQSVVFCGTGVSDFFLMSNSSNILKVYWIDSSEQAKQIKQLSSYINCATQLDLHITNVREIYSTLTNYIYSKTGHTLTGDADIERFFSGRDWGATTEAEIHIRQIAKNETRAGVLRRFDLENEAETLP